MSDERNVSRRDLLKQGTLAAALTMAMPPVVARALEAAKDPAAAAADAAKAAKNPGEPVRIGWIGSGIQGQNDLRQLARLPWVKIVAVADIYPPSQKGAKTIA